ncbi:pitrilysin family protein [Ruminococcus sp.]|uniref:EF-P 5-aminopentanol modification-associated protein YfmH n=1 Tax=Ruminococcus sp. TaxID=41978 RepID=UPI0025E0801D|nr:pitrilysin family protein [Ruminococcus sp.]
MNKEIIKSSRLGESYTVVHHPSGLDVLIWEMEGFTTTEAVFATKYGSVNNCFKTKDRDDFITVPEGIAHFLEHKLFENEDTDVFDLYAKTGANANAYTSFDETAYIFSCSENWEDSLEILLDFVQKPYFTEQSVHKELGIIGQEIKMCSDSPERQCFYNLLRAMYVNHPIKIDIAGTVESIAEITPELLYQCYHTFYNLHNMVLAIAGNVDEDKVIEICDRMLKPCDDLQIETKLPDEPEEVAQKEIRQSFPVGNPLFNIGFKCKPYEGRELYKMADTASVVLHMLIGSSSPLYKQLFDDGLINSQFGVEVFTSVGVFAPMISGESHDPMELYKRFLAEIDRVKAEGFDKELFANEKRSMYGDIVRGSNNPERAVDILSESYLEGADAFCESEILAQMTIEDCQKVLELLFDKDKAAISIIDN